MTKKLFMLALRFKRVSCFALGLIVLLANGYLRAQEPDDAGIEFFEKKIRPVLVEHCYECHAEDAKKVRAGLLLDTREGVLRGGESGAALTPGKPEESLLLEAIRYETFEMPPDGQLPEEVVADFEHWIRLGAPDPRDGPMKRIDREIDIEAGRQFWAFQPPRSEPLPEVNDKQWPRTAVDQYILAGLEAEGLGPAADADRVALVRRAYYALIGLPPSTSEIDDFVNDPAALPVAFATVVDRLLGSQHFGERWGRHWLDVARFAESSGGGRSLMFPEAWRYRDYVIEAFNEDVPYNQFIQQQIAGDLIEATDWQQQRRNITATAFLVLGPTNYELQDKEVLEMDIVDEQLGTIGRALLGMTLGCARCHDHKFDPIPTRDYYALAGILKSTNSVIHANVSKWNTISLPVAPEENAIFAASESQIAALEGELKSLTKAFEQAGGDISLLKDTKSISLAGENESTSETERRSQLAAKIQEIKAEIKRQQAASPKRPVAMAVVDHDEIGDIPLAIRGVVQNVGPIVPRGVLQVALKGELPGISKQQSGRMQLAEWIASSENPLTSRVMVNRIWSWLFDQGLVRTVDNFGAMGETPTHPELLDYLATQFVEEGWSVKRMIRRLMLSRVYQLSSATNTTAEAVDPDNKLYWRMNRQRLDAESIRDTLLLLGGNLDLSIGGSNIREGTKSEYAYEFENTRRSVYEPVFRNSLPAIFAAFDFADPNIQVGRRTRSTTAPQALLLMNHPLVMEQAAAAAQRLLASDKQDSERRIVEVYRQVLGRSPSESEAALAQRFVGDSDEVERWGRLYHTLFLSLDFRFLD